MRSLFVTQALFLAVAAAFSLFSPAFSSAAAGEGGGGGEGVEGGGAGEGGEGVVFEAPERLFKDCLAEAKKTGRMVMLDLYADWCRPCKMLAGKTFADPRVGALMKKFVNVRINAEVGEGPALAKGYKLAAYPFVLFLDGDGREVDWIVGYLDAGAFMKRVRGVLAGKNTFRDFKARCQADPGDLEAAVGYAEKLVERSDPGERELAYGIFEKTLEGARRTKSPQGARCIAPLVNRALGERDFDKAASLLEEEIATWPEAEGMPDACRLLARIRAEVEKDYEGAAAAVRKGLFRAAGTDRENLFRMDLAGYLEKKGDYDGALAEIGKITVEGDPLALNAHRVRILVEKGDAAGALALCRGWREEAGEDPEKINAVAWCCHENKILPEEALSWAEKMVALDGEKTAAFMDTYAWLLFDNKDPAKAAEWEEKALFAAETDRENEAYADALKTFREAIEKNR